ncbi:hypothetical protein [Dyadobacter jejuensis]|nr:hypothetical protein [Dyadobacter jejuensis]
MLMIFVLIFSWLPNPDIGLLPIFPHWLGEWTNKNKNLRTAVPFVFLGFIGPFLPLFSNKSIWTRAMLVLVSLLFLVSMAEVGQLLLPRRHFDWGDIGWGMAGTLLGMLPALAIQQLVLKKKTL